MLKANLSDAYSKLNRANEHISDVEALIANFLSSDFYKVRLEADQGTGRAKLIFDSLHQPDKRLNVLVGDAIGNLRSSLDYLFYALVFPLVGDPKMIGGFPFADDVNGFKGEIGKQGGIAQCGAAIVDLLVDQVQPYQQGAGRLLWMINKLRNIDKHRLLVASIDLAAVKLSFKIGGGSFNDCTFGAIAGQSSILVDFPFSEFKLNSEIKPTYKVLLNEPPHVDRVEAVPLLRGASVQIETLLDALKILCV